MKYKYQKYIGWGMFSVPIGGVFMYVSENIGYIETLKIIRIIVAFIIWTIIATRLIAK